MLERMAAGGTAVSFSKENLSGKTIKYFVVTE